MGSKMNSGGVTYGDITYIILGIKSHGFDSFKCGHRLIEQSWKQFGFQDAKYDFLMTAFSLSRSLSR